MCQTSDASVGSVPAGKLSERPLSGVAVTPLNDGEEARRRRRHTALNVRFRDQPIGGPTPGMGRIRANGCSGRTAGFRFRHHQRHPSPPGPIPPRGDCPESLHRFLKAVEKEHGWTRISTDERGAQSRSIAPPKIDRDCLRSSPQSHGLDASRRPRPDPGDPVPSNTLIPQPAGGVRKIPAQRKIPLDNHPS